MRDGMQGAERMAIMLIRGRLIRVCTTKGTIRGGGTKRPQWPTKQLRRVGLNALWRCGSGSIRSEPEQPKLARTSSSVTVPGSKSSVRGEASDLKRGYVRQGGRGLL
jgi:hypothetical protein